MAEEKMTTSETGGMKASKPEQLMLIDPLALHYMGVVAGYGAEKYDEWNYAKGYPWSKSMNALMRHFLAFAAGEYWDEENNAPHLASAAWHACALMTFWERGLGTDDRITAFLGDLGLGNGMEGIPD